MEEKNLNVVENNNVVVENNAVVENKVAKKETKKKIKKSTKETETNFSSILERLNKSTEGLLKTAKGTKNSDLYKESLFIGMSDKQKKVTRKKIRNIVLSLSESLIQEKDKVKLEKLKKAFLEFYKETYKINDFSLSSVCSENMKQSNKELLEKVLKIVKK